MPTFPTPWRLVVHEHRNRDESITDFVTNSHGGKFLWIEDEAGSAIAMLWSPEWDDMVAHGEAIINAINGTTGHPAILRPDHFHGR